jgi:DNA replication and repair protein RecF
MYLEKLYLNNFRNISNEELKFDKNVNIFFGENGQGKTSILESIYYLSISKSFRVNSEKITLQHSKEYFNIKGKYNTKNNNDIFIRLFYSIKDGKNIFLNENKIEKFSEIIGIVPTVLLSLEDLELTYGVPANRRRFLDILLSQVSPLYLQALQNYKKSLLQRNKLLSLINDNKESKKALFPWDEQLVQYGVEIISSRLKIVEYLNTKIAQYYKIISDKNENISINYKSNLIKKLEKVDIDKLKNKYFELLSLDIENDILRQTTLIGPHRDDVEFLKDDHLIKSFGSQGENKTFLIALKFVESEYLKEKKNESPVLLMDDIFSELDSKRNNNLVKYIKNIGQIFITTTQRDKFKNSYLKDSNYIEIRNGAVIY